MAATLDDVVDVLKEQNKTLDELYDNSKKNTLQDLERQREASRSSRIAQVVRGTGQAAGGIGSGIKSVGEGAGGLLGGLSKIIGAAALPALGGLLALNFLDTDKIKKNAETLLSIGDRYEQDGLRRFAADGAVIVGLGFLGKALVAFGVGGAVNAGVEYFAGKGGVKDWAQTVKQNVELLLSIGDGMTISSFMQDAGSVAILGGLGAALVAFGAGSGINAAVDLFAKPDWADKVKKSVETLLSIEVGLGGMVKGLIELPVTMAGIAGGLAVFSVGKFADGVASFVAKDGFAKQIKDDIETLLSILDLKNATFTGTVGITSTLAAIGAGLAIFGAGKGIAGVSDGVGEGIAAFTAKGDGFAQKIKDDIKTLLSVLDIPSIGKNTNELVLTLSKIGAGLAIFGGGRAIAGIGEGIAEGISAFTSKDGFAQKIYDDIKKIISITELASVQKSEELKTSLSNIGTALSKFGTGELSGAFKGALASMFGRDGVIDGLSALAEQADGLDRVANAVERLVPALNRLNAIRISSSVDDSMESFEKLVDQISRLNEAGEVEMIKRLMPMSGEVLGGNQHSQMMNQTLGELRQELTIMREARNAGNVSTSVGNSIGNTTVTNNVLSGGRGGQPSATNQGVGHLPAY